MTVVVRDLNRRFVPNMSRKQRYYHLREIGTPIRDAAGKAGITISYAETLEGILQKEIGKAAQNYAPAIVEGGGSDEGYVSALVAAGGLARLSERPTRTGHIACLPLIPFGVRS